MKNVFSTVDKRAIILCYVILSFSFLLSSCSSMTEKIVGKNCKEFYGWVDHYLCDKVEK